MNNSFPNRLKQARELKKLTQYALATLVGVSRQTIRNYETGVREPSMEILSKLIDSLNVSFDWLIGKSATAFPLEYDLSAANKQYIDIFSERLRTTRKKKNYTEEFCAKKLKLPLPDFIQIENAETIPNIFLVCKIAEILETSVDWLLGKDATVSPDELIPRKYIPAPFDRNLRERLITLRKIFNYSTEDVAFFIRIKPDEYELFETGKTDPPVAIMLNLARLYKLPIESLSLENSFFIAQLKNRFNNNVNN